MPRLSALAALAMMMSLPVSMAAAADPAAAPAAAATQPPSAAASVAPPASPASSDAEQLKGVTVKGKRDLLGESDAKMKKLKESLPDMNSDVGHKESLAQRVVDKTRAYLGNHSDPNKMDDEGKALIDRVQNSVDNTQNAGRTRVDQPDARDYADPLCQTGSCPP